MKKDTGAAAAEVMAVDRVIHEPARMYLMVLLAEVEEADFIFLMQKTGLTWGNLSSHLSKLEGAGYVEIRKEFMGKKPRTVVKQTKEGAAAFKKYRQRMSGVLKGT